MKIWLIHLGELLPIDGDVRLFRYGMLADKLVERGHQVTYWAPTFIHTAKKHRVDHDQSIDLNKLYRIELLYAEGYQKHLSFSRWRFHRQIAMSFARRSEILPEPDVILSAMPTPETSLAAVEYGKRHQVPVVIDVRDLWPDIYFDYLPKFVRGIAKWMMWPLFFQNKKIFRDATAITAISSSYLQWGITYSGRPKSDFDRVFHMGYRKEQLSKVEEDKIASDWTSRGVDRSSFICCFFGTIGHQFDLETIIDAARIFQERGENNVQFVICGDGERLVYYKNLAGELRNIIFPGWVEKAEITLLMDWAEVGLAPYCKHARMSLPNKPFEYFSGNLPVISSLSGGELEKILAEHNCGITYSPGDVNLFIKAIQRLRKNPDLRKQMGYNAYQLYKNKYSADHVYPTMINYLEKIVSKFS